MKKGVFWETQKGQILESFNLFLLAGIIEMHVFWI